MDFVRPIVLANSNWTTIGTAISGFPIGGCCSFGCGYSFHFSFVQLDPVSLSTFSVVAD